MIVDWQYEPIKSALLHVDLKRIAMDKVLQVQRAHRDEGRSAGRQGAGRHPGADVCAKWKSSACRPTFPATSMPTSAS